MFYKKIMLHLMHTIKLLTIIHLGFCIKIDKKNISHIELAHIFL